MRFLNVSPIVLLILFILFLGYMLIFPVWGYRAGSKRTIGGAGGLLLGLFFNLLGILIVYCTNKTSQQPIYNFKSQSTADSKSQSAADELQKYKQLLDSGAITEAEYNAQKAKILSS